MSKAVARIFVCLALFVFFSIVLPTAAFAQQAPFFTPGNVVVAVEGCGVHGGCAHPSQTALAPVPT